MKIGDLIPIGSVGNAVTSDVLQGKTFSSSSGTDLNGIMANNGSLLKTITTQGGSQKLIKGYYEGGEVKAQFNNLVPENVKKGVNIGGILGNFTEGIVRNVSTSLYAPERAKRTTILFKDIPSNAKVVIFEGSMESKADAGSWGLAFGKNNSDSEYRLIADSQRDVDKWVLWVNSICTIHDDYGRVTKEDIRYSSNPVSLYPGNNAFLFYHYGSTYGGGTAYISGKVTVLW